MNKTRRIVALSISLSFGMGLLLLGLALPRVALSSDNRSGQQDGQVVGLASNALACLAVGTDLPDKASGVVQLTWRGQIKHARLVLSIAGSEAVHHIKVNGQLATWVPAHTEGQPCSTQDYFYLDIPPEILVQGDNLIEITNDARAGDQWTAANVRIEVFGELTPDVSAFVSPFATSAVSVTEIITYINPYDGSSQNAVTQIPDGYDGITPTPLVIAVHGRTSVMEWGIDQYGTAANVKGWLLASPQLHGSWPIPSDCYLVPPGPLCESDDQMLLTKPGAFAYASLESEYDVIGTVKYMIDHYNVKQDQIYVVGDSMGSQVATVTAAKYPHVFAAVFDNKGPTNMDQWYYENNSYYKKTMRKECHIGGVLQDPALNLFCYQRRSGVNFATNYIHTPISITHSISDVSVPIHHSRDLRDAINGYGPDRRVSVYEDTVVGPACPPNYHCYEPDPLSVLSFLEQFILNSHPTYINITTDESKSYHWMNLTLTGGDHWSHVSAVYDPISATVRATISDTRPLTVAFNLGAAPITGTAGISQPGMGLPATTYLIKGSGSDLLSMYTSGYLTVPLASTGEFSLTISAIDASLSANPSSVAGGQASFSTITAAFEDRLNNPVPNGVAVEFSASAGLFPNGASIYTATTSGGQATALLTLSPGFTSPLITASIGNVSATTSVEVIALIYLPAVMRN